MKSNLFCLVGLAIGVFLGANLGIFKVESNEPVEPTPSASTATPNQTERIQQLEQKLSEKEAALEAAKSKLAEHDQTSSAGNSAAVAEAIVEEEEPVNPFLANAQSMALESGKARRSEELEKLKLSLNLTPEQLTALEVFYEQDAAREAKVMEQVFAGKSQEAIQEEAMESMSSVKYRSADQLLEDILSPEQKEVYEVNKEQEALERKEAGANMKLSMLQRQFLLNEEQKDVGFEIFYEREYAVKSDEWEALEIDANDPEFIVKSKNIENERLLEALSDTLTPEQLEMYRTKLKNETEMMRKSMQMFRPR